MAELTKGLETRSRKGGKIKTQAKQDKNEEVESGREAEQAAGTGEAGTEQWPGRSK